MNAEYLDTRKRFRGWNDYFLASIKITSSSIEHARIFCGAITDTV